MKNVQFAMFHILLSVFVLIDVQKTAKCTELVNEDVDKVIEDEITYKLSDDLVQSIERKFQVDLERSVDSVLAKIKLLLQNGTIYIQDRLVELQKMLDIMKKDSSSEVDACLLNKQNETAALAEKALHQMVVCGYALIGHDPGQAVRNVIEIKNMIKQKLKPLYEQKLEVYKLLKVCGHEHDSLKKVVKCVISKSPLIKTAMMDVTAKLIEGIVGLTKLMAHGAMHEACLIEVIKSIEDEAFVLVQKVKSCTYRNSSYVEEETNKFLQQNNATVLDVNQDHVQHDKIKDNEEDDMQVLLRRMLDKDNKELDKDLKEKLSKFKYELSSINSNTIANDEK